MSSTVNIMMKVLPATDADAEVWTESETAMREGKKHLLDEISDFGFWKSTPAVASTSNASVPLVAKKRLYVTVSIMDIKSIDPMNENFSCKFRMYCLWETNLRAIGLGDIAERATAAGHFTNMSEDEKEAFNSASPVPIITVFNAVGQEDTDPADIRAYGSKNENNYVMWNKLYDVTCRERFELHNFPFDLQDLHVELRLNDPKTWDAYDLTVHTVQFHKQAIEQTEWSMLAPAIKRDSPAWKATKIRFHVLRMSTFYIQNVVLTMFVLSLLGLLSFTMDVTDVGSRVGNLLTLILTAVAFKFILASTLPKVPYNTVIDYWILYSSASLAIMAFLTVIPSFLSNQTAAVDLNLGLAMLSVFICCAGLAVWLLVAYLVTHRRKEFTEIKVAPGQNWYSYHFGMPPFLASGVQTKAAPDIGKGWLKF